MGTQRQRAAVVGLLTVVVVGTSLVLFEGFSIASLERALAVGLACAAIAAIALVPALRSALTMRMVLVASLLLMTIAVVQPPEESHDLFSYAMNGRIVEHYGASPYAHVPADYPHDPLLAQVGTGWRHTRSLYGPAFTAVSAGIMSVADSVSARTGGTSLLSTRLGFQLLAALCVLAALILLVRTTRDPVVVLLVGCNPVIIIEIVNVGRNDAIVGLALLGGVLLATRRRLVAAAVVLALAALVKIAAIAALGAVLLWMWRRHGVRPAARAAAVGAAIMAVPYVIAGGLNAIRPVVNASNRMSRASIWQLTRTRGSEHLLGIHDAQRVGTVIGSVGPFALLTVVGLAVLFSLSRLDDPTPELVAIGAMVAFLLAGSYVLASYAAWVIPIAAWRHRAGISRVVLVWSALLTVAYQAVRPMPTTLEDQAVWLVSSATLLVALVAIVGLSVAAVQRLRHGQGVRPASPASRSAIGASSDTATSGPKMPAERISLDSMPRATW